MKLFSIVPNQGSYRATRHQFKLIFQFRTTVKAAICDFIPKSALTISPFTELLETKEDFNFLVDVVGLLVSVSEEKEYDKDGKKMKMDVMELAENDYRIRYALFGEYVNELNRFLSSGYAEQSVVILQLAKNWTSECYVYIKLGFNLDIPEVTAFWKRYICTYIGAVFVNNFIPHGVSASQPIGIVSCEKNNEIEEDFMKLTPRCTVKLLDDNNRVGTSLVFYHLYSSIICLRIVLGDTLFVRVVEVFRQNLGFIFVNFATSMFRMKVLVEDSIGVSIFVLFDREASYLLNKTCAQLFEQHLKDVDVSQSNAIFFLCAEFIVKEFSYPSIFTNTFFLLCLFYIVRRLCLAHSLLLYSKKLLEKLCCLRPVGMEKFKGTYPVMRVCDDAAIVGMSELSGSDLSPAKEPDIPFRFNM
ncbi:hypothetical protein Ahy_A09g043529 [Arachis hypogaea]|uniref:DUF223 domain-containing protein n=1 Tax=Arachis hypogaea TaxID=3818 RepID=A0A445BIQ3_ARAHY|nr:hypothetical protein Ahy_A09g043529 [Arachis hypogaea]